MMNEISIKYLCELEEGLNVLGVDSVPNEVGERGDDGGLAALAVGAAERQRQRHGVRDLRTINLK